VQMNFDSIRSIGFDSIEEAFKSALARPLLCFICSELCYCAIPIDRIQFAFC
jgi:hypothetical protein